MEENQNDEMLGIRLKQLREASNRTLSDITSDTGIQGNLVSMYERNERTPSLRNLRILADFYNVSTDFLLGRSNELKVINIEKSDQELLEEVVEHFMAKTDVQIKRMLEKIPVDDLQYLTMKLISISKQKRVETKPVKRKGNAEDKQ